MKKLAVNSFGPIQEGAVEFGDLTVLVGPQASGKSLFVQLFKAIQDAGAIRKTLKDYGFDWLRDKNPQTRLNQFLSLYFGEGMESIWKTETKIYVDDIELDFAHAVVTPRNRPGATDSVLLIPAQRVLVLQDGWPSPLLSRSVEAPHCMRLFSDILRKLLDEGLGRAKAIFPQPHRLKEELRRLLDEGIYVGGKLNLDIRGMRRRLVLQPSGSATYLPFSTWSAGQREFTPLLLGLYWLIPSGSITKQDLIDTAIIEEPETGLHPQAILSFCLLVLELLNRGYKVVISTHSPVILDVVWAIRGIMHLPEDIAVEALKEIFALHRMTPSIRDVLANALKKDYRVYYFERMPKKNAIIRDISSLDPSADNESVSGWGGLSGFSGRTADVVGKALAKGQNDASRP